MSVGRPCYDGLIVHCKSGLLAQIVEVDHDWITTVRVKWVDTGKISEWIADYDFRKLTPLEALAWQSE